MALFDYYLTAAPTSLPSHTHSHRVSVHTKCHSHTRATTKRNKCSRYYVEWCAVKPVSSSPTFISSNIGAIMCMRPTRPAHIFIVPSFCTTFRFYLFRYTACAVTATMAHTRPVLCIVSLRPWPGTRIVSPSVSSRSPSLSHATLFRTHDRIRYVCIG